MHSQKDAKGSPLSAEAPFFSSRLRLLFSSKLSLLVSAASYNVCFYYYVEADHYRLYNSVVGRSMHSLTYATSVLIMKGSVNQK